MLGLRFYFSLLLAFSFVMEYSQAQTTIEWDHTYGSSGWEELNDIISTDDGGYILGGITGSQVADGEVTFPSRGGSSDMWIIKTDSLGEKIWDRRFGGNEIDRLWAIAKTSDGGFILGGESNSSVGGEKSEPSQGWLDYWIVKIDRNGNYLWDKTYGGDGEDKLFGVYQTPDGGFVLAGFSNSNANQFKSVGPIGGLHTDFWVLKIDPAGNVLWDYTYGGDNREQLFCFTPTSDNGFLLGGSTESGVSGNKTTVNMGLNDYWLVKIDQNGIKQWDKSYGGAGLEVMLDVIETPTGDLYLGGFSSSAPDPTTVKMSPNYGAEDSWLIHTDAQGSVKWEKTFGGDKYDQIYGIRRNAAGFLMTIGTSYSDASGNKSSPLKGNNDYWVHYLDPQGNALWDDTFGGDDIDSGVNIYFANDGGYLLAGHSSSSQNQDKSEPSRGFNDFWFLKTYCPISSPIFPEATPICKNEVVELDAGSIDNCELCSYLWSDGSTAANLSLTITQDTTLQVEVTHQDGCVVNSTASFRVLDAPVKVDVAVLDIDCETISTGTLVANTIQGGTAPYSFSIDGDNFYQTSTFSNLEAGQYQFFVEDMNGCSMDTMVTIEPPAIFQVEIGNRLNVTFGDSVQVEVQSTAPIDSFFWVLYQPIRMNCTDCLSPILTPTESAFIKLVAFNSKGCRAEDQLELIVNKERLAYVPSAFSPNGNGSNERFTIYGNQAVDKIKKMQVFNRWGQMVFDGKDMTPGVEAQGWDGFFKGEPAKVDVYTYLIEVLYLDGRTELFTGNVNLIR